MVLGHIYEDKHLYLLENTDLPLSLCRLKLFREKEIIKGSFCREIWALSRENEKKIFAIKNKGSVFSIFFQKKFVKSSVCRVRVFHMKIRGIFSKICIET